MAKILSSGRTYYGPSWLGEVYDAVTNTEQWLYGPWNKEKYDVYTRLNSFGPMRDYMDLLLDRRSDSEYLRRYGMDYSDIHDPRKLRQSSSTARVYGSSYTMISRNVSRLYR